MHSAGKEFRQTAELNWRPAKTWIKMKNPKASAAARAIDGTFLDTAH
jgi:hypothetical protein